jgi:peptidoglycan hydrolase-like protein with peptidoglycan-binding domain
MSAPDETLRAVQRALNQWNRHLEPLAEDGAMGPKTQARIRQYQMAKSLDVTGEADAATLAALGVAKVAA